MIKKTLFGVLVSAVCLGQVFTGCTTSKMQTSALSGNQLTLAAAENQPVNAVEAEQKTIASKSFVENKMPVAPAAPVAIASTEKGASPLSVSRTSAVEKTDLSNVSKKNELSPLKKNVAKKIKKEKSGKSPMKNQIVAAVLAFFLGMLGIHRFYLGYTTIGLIQLGMFIVGLITSLFIVGFFILLALWIWVIIDFIRILIGSLEPANGSYD